MGYNLLIGDEMIGDGRARLWMEYIVIWNMYDRDIF